MIVEMKKKLVIDAEENEEENDFVTDCMWHEILLV